MQRPMLSLEQAISTVRVAAAAAVAAVLAPERNSAVPPQKETPLKETETERGRERERFGYRAEEDEDAVGRGCCRGCCTEANTNRTSCVIQVSRCRSRIRGALSQSVCERTITSGDLCFKDSEGGEAQPEKTSPPPPQRMTN